MGLNLKNHYINLNNIYKNFIKILYLKMKMNDNNSNIQIKIYFQEFLNKNLFYTLIIIYQYYYIHFIYNWVLQIFYLMVRNELSKIINSTD